MNAPTLTNDHKTTSREVDKPTTPLVVKYTTHLPQEWIRWVKLYAVQHDMKDYAVMQQALDHFRRHQEAA